MLCQDSDKTPYLQTLWVCSNTCHNLLTGLRRIVFSFDLKDLGTVASGLSVHTKPLVEPATYIADGNPSGNNLDPMIQSRVRL